MANQITSYPPFEPPAHYKKAHLWCQRRIPDGYSDGDQRHWPACPPYRDAADEFYLCTLGQKWAEKDGIAQPGVQYYIDKLPRGYAMFEVNQPGGSQVYRRLFGHPKGRFYDSALRFAPHFLWIVSGMEGECECVFCGKKQIKPIVTRQPRAPREVIDRSLLGNQRNPRDTTDDDEDNESSRASPAPGGIASKRTQRQARQVGGSHAVDEEGNEDIYKDCVKKLENARADERGVEIDLSEEGSIDWKADRQSLPQYLTQIEQQHSFIPRVGELVLWCPTFLDQHYLMLDPQTSEYKFYSFEHECFHGFPAWRGGVVAAVPSASGKNGPVDFPDILDIPAKKTSFNTAGFRIETMPDPNDDLNKAMSKQYRYVSLRQIRPLAHWQLLLRGISPDKLHPSVQHALTCMTSISLLEKWRFNGNWPDARIFCKAVFLGPELITVGDTLRLSSSKISGKLQPDVLVIDSIRYNLLDIKPEHARPETSPLCSRSYITFVGSAYTMHPETIPKPQTNSDKPQDAVEPLKTAEIKTLFRSVGAEEYGQWYPWHKANQRYEVSHESVLGRLYEADAVRLWTGQSQIEPEGKTKTRPHLDHDLNSIVAGRLYATATDARLPEPQSKSEVNWFLADTRAEALAVTTVNGMEVGKYQEVRTTTTLKRWRDQVKIADGQQVAPEVEDEFIKDLSKLQFYTGAKRGRPAGSRVVDGKLIRPGQIVDKDGSDDIKEDKIKPSSQMAGAAFATDHDDSSEQYYSDDAEEYDTSDDPTALTGPTRDEQQLSRSKQALSKADIMGSIEVPDDEIFDEDVSDDDEKWWHDPPPLARGGTEESEGGDYRE